MRVILISGAPNTGKSEVSKKLYELLKNKGFNEIEKDPNGYANKDYIVIFEGKDKNGNLVRILLNYAADNDDIINTFLDWLKNKEPFDIVITVMRTKGNLYDRVKNAFNNSDIILTLPLKRITAQNYQLNEAIEYYQDGIVCTAEKYLQDAFSLF